jgi:hypothetical protein
MRWRGNGAHSLTALGMIVQAACANAGSFVEAPVAAA